MFLIWLRVCCPTRRPRVTSNLRATPTCVVERDGDLILRRAVPLDGAVRASAVTRLILKYGAPAERLGAGPAFRLLPRE